MLCWQLHTDSGVQLHLHCAGGIEHSDYAGACWSPAYTVGIPDRQVQVGQLPLHPGQLARAVQNGRAALGHHRRRGRPPSQVPGSMQQQIMSPEAALKDLCCLSPWRPICTRDLWICAVRLTEA